MARKPILEGGKKDEIIAAATELFFTEGYENTSVRKVLSKVNGEIGMFYHYFSSKEELFEAVCDNFFRQYAKGFGQIISSLNTPAEFIEVFLPFYEKAMNEYHLLETNMHWTIRLALHDRTLISLIPAVEDLLVRTGYSGKYPLDIAATKLIADISAVIHSHSFEGMQEAEKKQMLNQLLRDI